MFLTSPRNSVVAHNSLLKRLNCTTLISPVPQPPPVTTILEAYSLNVLDVPSVDELASKEHPISTFRRLILKPPEILAVLHTSGSTGIPKPIFWTHDTACKHMEVVALEPEGYESLDHWNQGKRMYLVPPPFHPVTAALVAGSQRFQASLLVEVNGKDLSVGERAAMIEKIWPSIGQANEVCPAHARVAKTHILFTPSNKPMLRAGKGTIQRAGTLAQYTPELDTLYIDADKLAQDDDTENWFNLGLDSLQTITATRIFKRGLDSPTLTPNLIYLHPTVIGLTQAVLRLQQHQEASTEAQKEAQLQDRDQLLQELIGQLAIGTAPTKSPMAHTVLLTGSTGNLGAYMLDTLLRNPTVRHVHCLSRKDGAIDVQRKKSEAYNLNLDMSRVSFWAADLSQPDFRLQSDIYQKLQSATTLVIHNS
ncbi:hypothetical protein APSETT444_000551 [Aspergillus pseudonomiae]